MIENDRITLLEKARKQCSYENEMDRDIHAAKNMIEFYNRYIQWGGTLHLRPRRKIRYSSYNDLFRQEALSL